MLPIQSKLIILSSLICAAVAGSAVAQTTPPAAPAAVVATQGSVSVTLEDLDAFAARMPIGQRAGFFNSPTRIEGVITNLLVQKQLANEARKAGLDRDPEVARQVALATDDTLGNARLQRFRADVKVPDFSELAQEEYLAHKENYATAGKLTVKHVLIATKSRSAAEAKTIADTVAKEAKAYPDQFDALIEKYSDDSSKAANHGLMEQVGEKGKYAAEFTKAAKALGKPGDISPVVSTAYGFHVLRLVERTPDHQRSFDEVRLEIVARLGSEYVDKAVKNHTDELRNQPMDANADVVASLRTRYGKSPTIPSDISTPPAGK